ncbi:hypothetical protein N2152v2_004995 [Parachlorella kessleri]
MAAQEVLSEAKQLVDEKARPAGMGGAVAESKWRDFQARGDTTVFLHPDRLAASGCPALASFLASTIAQLQPWLAGQGYDVGGRPTCQLGCYPGGGARYVRHRDASLTCSYRTVTAMVYLNPGWRPDHGGELCVYHLHTSPPTELADPAPPVLPQRRCSELDVARAAAESTTEHVPAGQGTSTDAGGEGSATAAGAAVKEATASPGFRIEEKAEEAARKAAALVNSGLEEGHAALVVPPVAGRLVVFDSRTEHEVLPSYAPRYALAIWFTRAEASACGDQQREVVQSGQCQQDRQPLAGEPVPSPSQPVPITSPQQHGQAAYVGMEEDVRRQQQEEQQQGVDEAQPAMGGRFPAGCEIPPVDPQKLPALDTESIARPGHIFVSIASYRDSETQWTLLDLFEKAAQPSLLRVGVGWQVDWARDAGFVRIAPGGEAWLPQVRQVIVSSEEATGPCKARALAQQLWDGEEFYLQVDSHMRFVQGWDTLLLGMLRQAEQQAQHARVVLSTYPPGYQGQGLQATLPRQPPLTVLCATHFDADGMLRTKGRALRSPPAAPLPALFWAAGFSFSRAQLLQEVPYDPSLGFLFFGEEMYQLVRMWRQGWDVFTPCCPVVFHLWSRAHRPTFQRDNLPAAGASASSVGRSSKEQGGHVVCDAARAVAAGGNGIASGGPAEPVAGTAAAVAREQTLDQEGSPGASSTAALQQRKRSQQVVLRALGRRELPCASTGQQPQLAAIPVLEKGPSGPPLVTRAATAVETPAPAPASASGCQGTQAARLRSLEQFYEYCGVDFAAGIVGERARNERLASDSEAVVKAEGSESANQSIEEMQKQTVEIVTRETQVQVDNEFGDQPKRDPPSGALGNA